MRLSILALLLAAAAGRAQRASDLLPAEIIQGRLARIHSKNSDRAQELRQMFGEAGCDDRHYSQENIQSSALPNLICTLPGSSRRIIVVGAHFDNKGPGEGAIDNWSGAALLSSLFETLRTQTPRLTYEFIAFTDEERGLIGSRDFAGHLSKQHRADILLNVNVDSIGLPGPIRVWSNRADDFLLTSAALVADQVKLSIGASDLSTRFDSDASAFMAWRIPVIDFHSLTPNTLQLLHSTRDVRAMIDAKSYYDQYRFLAAYLAYLDANVEIPAK
jgi:Zn-dependent M28 family amino/carboxypeptidase